MTPAVIVSVISLIVGVASAIITALLRYAISNRDSEIDEKLARNERDVKKAIDEARANDREHDRTLQDEVRAMTGKLHDRELAHAKLEGEVKVLSKSHETIERDVKEIKESMVPRTEWREAQDRIESAQSRLEGKLDQAVRLAQWRPTPGQMQAVRAPLPREEGDLGEYKTTPTNPRKR